MTRPTTTAEQDEVDAPSRVLSTEQALDFAATQAAGLIERSPQQTATYTDGGKWVLSEDRWAPRWTGGFFAGQVWIHAQRTGDPWWWRQAEAYSAALEERKYDRGTHDLGFVLEPSFGRWFALTGSSDAREVLATGGRTMAGRMQRSGGYLPTWVDPGSTFIDIMMNVGIVFRAAEYLSDESLAETAMTHCRTTRRFLVRGDGSTAHEGWFDTDTGQFLRTATHQGWRADSSWARGQAWAIYGFATAFGYSGDRDMLTTAKQVADYYILRTDATGVPPNDWDDPAPAVPWESSAAAVAAAGMLELAEVLRGIGDASAAQRYASYAGRILASLRSTTFLAADTPGWQGVLKHAIYHSRHGLGVDESVMWGDYYFVEALDRASRSGLLASGDSTTTTGPTIGEHTNE